MNWRKVKLIFFRELRDQLRDRRTLFMIAVLPVLLYPLMGMTFLQISQFLREHPTTVGIVNAAALPEDPPLLRDGGFDPRLFSDPARAELLEVQTLSDEVKAGEIDDWAERRMEQGDLDVLVYIPADFATQLRRVVRGDSESSSPDRVDTPQPRLFFSGAKDRSRVAYERVVYVLDRWRSSVVERTLTSREIPAAAAQPFQIGQYDVAKMAGRRAAMWSKVLPFVLILWALTGAFYPAIDLCAGEKERGTLETLLCAPAQRKEIVVGKLATVSLFSMATSLLNLVSLTITGALVLNRIQMPNGAEVASMGPPPLSVMLWMVVALVPLAAMFSALSLALATMARSTKEGQYYLMPLMLITMPLSMIAVLPTTEISLGTAIIPVTGVMLVLRSLIEGNYLLALKFILPTAAVTAVCCWLSIRWAVQLFNDESVLFRESERFSVRIWLRHLIRDRGVTPSLAEAFVAGLLLLLLQFFFQLVAVAPTSWSDFVVSTLTVQLGVILAPTVLMAVMLTASPSTTLLLKPVRWSALLGTVALAVCVQPAAWALRDVVQAIYPISPDTLALLAELSKLMSDAETWQILLLLAVTPAICEELAFRGFILSGLRHVGNKGMAIFISSLFFGIVHGILQQSINAFALGMILGFIAVQTGSLIPCVTFHCLHNGMQVVASAKLTAEALQENPALRILFVESSAGDGAISFRVMIIFLSVLATALLLRWFRSMPFSPSPEERLQDALEHQGPVVREPAR